MGGGQRFGWSEVNTAADPVFERYLRAKLTENNFHLPAQPKNQDVLQSLYEKLQYGELPQRWIIFCCNDLQALSFITEQLAVSLSLTHQISAGKLSLRNCYMELQHPARSEDEDQEKTIDLLRRRVVLLDGVGDLDVKGAERYRGVFNFEFRKKLNRKKVIIVPLFYNNTRSVTDFQRTIMTMVLDALGDVFHYELRERGQWIYILKEVTEERRSERLRFEI